MNQLRSKIYFNSKVTAESVFKTSAFTLNEIHMNFQLLFEEFRKAPTLNAHLFLLLLLENNPFLLLTMRKNYLEGKNHGNLQRTLLFSFQGKL